MFLKYFISFCDEMCNISINADDFASVLITILVIGFVVEIFKNPPKSKFVDPQANGKEVEVVHSSSAPILEPKHITIEDLINNLKDGEYSCFLKNLLFYLNDHYYITYTIIGCLLYMAYQYVNLYGFFNFKGPDTGGSTKGSNSVGKSEIVEDTISSLTNTTLTEVDSIPTDSTNEILTDSTISLGSSISLATLILAPFSSFVCKK